MPSATPVYISPRDLSRVPPFVFGPLTIDPPTRTIAAGIRSTRLEPRVMQVLVALAMADGQVLSRDDLIALCWDGRIVGDNAINRVISLLRQALAGCAGDTARLETITKVGFRLVAGEPASEEDTPLADSGANPAPPPAPRSALGRRTVLASGAVLAASLAAGGFALYLYRYRQAPDPRAVQLARKADLLMKSGLPGTTRQATRYLEQAVGIDPGYAAAWGQLACMYHHAYHGFSKGERASYPRLLRSAAQRALALNPSQPDALLALAVLRPFTGRWAEAEAQLRSICRRYPDHWYANGQLSLLLMDVGRIEESLPYRRKVIEIDPTIPVAWAFLARNQFLANRLQQADATLDTAMTTWPNHPALWFTRYDVLMQTGRPSEAAAFVRDVRYRPDNIPDSAIDELSTIAMAAADADRSARVAAARKLTGGISEAGEIGDIAPLLAALEQPDAAIAACTAFLLGGTFDGRAWPRPDQYDYRPTAMLFQPSLLALRQRPPFERILQQTGLEDYWKRSGSQPDFRPG